MDRNDHIQQSNQHDQFESGEPEKFSVRLNPAFDLDVGRNLSQAFAVAWFTYWGAIAGALCAFLWANDILIDYVPLYGAVVGGIAGLILGTFVSGFVLMLVPHRPVTVTRKEIVAKRKREYGFTRLGFYVSLVAFIVPAGILNVLMKPQMNLTDIMLVSCGITLIGICCNIFFSSLKLRYSSCSICKAQVELSIFEFHRCDLKSEDSNISPSA